jgi:hypothetical protein
MKLTNIISAFFFGVACMMASIGSDHSSWMALTISLSCALISTLDTNDTIPPL